MKLLYKFIISILLMLFVFSQSCFAENTLRGPVLGNISSGYGFRSDPFSGGVRFHEGIDIAAPLGSPIYALQDGIVIKSGERGNYGLAITIDHYYPDLPAVPRIHTTYAHNSVNFVRVGEYVQRGQVIALVGSTGRSTGPHLHFEVTYKGNSVDPIDYLVKLPSYLNYVAKYRNKAKFAYTQSGNY